jgi:hypothetical protein
MSAHPSLAIARVLALADGERLEFLHSKQAAILGIDTGLVASLLTASGLASVSTLVSFNIDGHDC